MNAITRAVGFFRFKAQFARAVGAYPQEVSRWLRTGVVPPGRCKAIEEAVKAEIQAAKDRGETSEALSAAPVTRYDLRPDVFGSAPEHPLPRRSSAVSREAAEATEVVLTSSALQG